MDEEVREPPRGGPDTGVRGEPFQSRHPARAGDVLGDGRRRDTQQKRGPPHRNPHALDEFDGDHRLEQLDPLGRRRDATRHARGQPQTVD